MSTISHLPNELLIEIANWTVQRHQHEGYTINSSDIAAFSSTSRLFRALALPILFKEIAINNHEQLFSLTQLDTELLGLTQYVLCGTGSTLSVCSAESYSPTGNSASSSTPNSSKLSSSGGSFGGVLDLPVAYRPMTRLLTSCHAPTLSALSASASRT